MDNIKDHEIWQAISHTVESGEETPKIDLKSELSRLDKNDVKAEFVKDVSAIANVSGKMGYIVIGVLDNKQRKTNDPNDYIVGLDPKDLEIRKQQMVQAAYEFITPSIIIGYRSLSHSKTGKKIGIVMIPSEYDRPYLISRDIGKLSKVKIFTRGITHTVEAPHDEIVRMTIKDEEMRHREEIESLKDSYEDRLLALKEENDSLKNENFILQGEKRRIAEDREKWISLGYQTCKELRDKLPEGKREEGIGLLLKRHGKEDYYNEWFKQS